MDLILVLRCVQVYQVRNGARPDYVSVPAVIRSRLTRLAAQPAGAAQAPGAAQTPVAAQMPAAQAPFFAVCPSYKHATLLSSSLLCSTNMPPSFVSGQSHALVQISLSVCLSFPCQITLSIYPTRVYHMNVTCCTTSLLRGASCQSVSCSCLLCIIERDVPDPVIALSGGDTLEGQRDGVIGINLAHDISVAPQPGFVRTE
jgi:hypothetical protein